MTCGRPHTAGSQRRANGTRRVDDGRKLLGALLEGPIVFTPFEESRARGYRFRGSAVLTGLIEGVAEVVRLSSPKYGEIWRPHRDSGYGRTREACALCARRRVGTKTTEQSEGGFVPTGNRNSFG